MLPKRVGLPDGVLDGTENPHTNAPHRDPEPRAVVGERHRMHPQPNGAPEEHTQAEVVVDQLALGVVGTERLVALVTRVVQLADTDRPKGRSNHSQTANEQQLLPADRRTQPSEDRRGRSHERIRQEGPACVARVECVAERKALQALCFQPAHARAEAEGEDGNRRCLPQGRLVGQVGQQQHQRQERPRCT